MSDTYVPVMPVTPVAHETPGCGALTALLAKGAQDTYMRADPSLFDARKQLLKGKNYQMVYQKIQTEVHYLKKHNDTVCMCFNIVQMCDLINELDLVISNPNCMPINTLIKRIHVEFGGQRMDVLCVPDLQTQIETNCALFGSGKTITNMSGKTHIPLVMAPFHDRNLVFPSSTYHLLQISVDFYEPTFNINIEKDIDKVEKDIDKYIVFYGNTYYLEQKDRKTLVDSSHDFMTVQNQFTGSEALKTGLNSFKLNFNHPVYLIYFWGFDKTKVTNVKLMLNKTSVFYDGSLAALEHNKIARGLGHIEPCVIFFSPDAVGEPTKSSVNFSRLDYSDLIIETTQELESPIHIVGLNIQPLRYVGGMVGLVFSK